MIRIPKNIYVYVYINIWWCSQSSSLILTQSQICSVGHVAIGEIRAQPFPAPSGHNADFSDNASGSVSCLICGDATEVFPTFKFNGWGFGKSLHMCRKRLKKTLEVLHLNSSETKYHFAHVRGRLIIRLLLLLFPDLFWGSQMLAHPSNANASWEAVKMPLATTPADPRRFQLWS